MTHCLHCLGFCFMFSIFPNGQAADDGRLIEGKQQAHIQYTHELYGR